MEIDQNDDLLWEYLRQPAFHDNRPPASLADAQILSRFQRIFASCRTPVACQSHRWDRYARQVAPPAVARRLRRFARHSLKGVRLATGW